MQNTLLTRLKKLFKKEEQKKEEHTMAKRKVNFTVTDGSKPRKLEGPGKPFGLKLPFSVTLPPRTTREVNLGVSCELPLLVVPAVLSPGLQVGVTTVTPGESVKVLLTSNSDTVTLSEGEIVARVYVIDNSDMELA